MFTPLPRCLPSDKLLPTTMCLWSITLWRCEESPHFNMMTLIEFALSQRICKECNATYTTGLVCWLFRCWYFTHRSRLGQFVTLILATFWSTIFFNYFNYFINALRISSTFSHEEKTSAICTTERRSIEEVNKERKWKKKKKMGLSHIQEHNENTIINQHLLFPSELIDHSNAITPRN